MTTPASPRARTWIERLPPTAEIALVLALTSGAGLLSALLRSSTTVILATSGSVLVNLAAEVLIGGGLAVFLTIRGWPLRALLGRPQWRDVRDAVIVLGAVALVVALMAFSLAAYYFTRGTRPPINGILFPSGAPVLLVAFGLFNPLFEELLWLGFWYRKLESRSPALATAVSLGLRTIAHLWKGVLGALTIIPIGGVFTLYYARKQRLWPVILAHAVMDITAIFGLIHARR